MAEILIQTFYPADSSLPQSAFDATARTWYDAWELNDEAYFSFVVPEGFQSPDDLVLKINYSTPGTEKKHKWQFKVGLFQPGTNVTSSATEQDTVTEEVTSDAVANQLNTTEVTLTTSGAISDTPVEAGDTVTVYMKRTSASESEDSNSIKVFNCIIVAETTGSTSTRVGNIISRVRTLFNESSGGFITDAEILSSINKCKDDLAAAGYFVRSTNVSAVADQQAYDLQDLLSDSDGTFVELHDVWSDDLTQPLIQVTNYAEFRKHNSSLITWDTGAFYWFDGRYLYMGKTPTAASTDAWEVRHSYCPTDISSASSGTPDWPTAYDDVAVHFALKEAYMKDRHANETDRLYLMHNNLWLQWKGKLLYQASSPALGFRV